MRKWIPTYDEVRSAVRRWFNPTSLVAERLRDTLMGVLVTAGLAEVCVYRLLQHHVAAGELTAYAAEALIVTHFVVEACVAPLVSWWGYRTRRRVFLTWASVLVACFTVWFLMQTPGEQQTGLCSTSRPEASTISAGRLLILLGSGPVLAAARAAVWSHGLAYIEDHAPDRIPLHCSVFVLARVLPLLIGMGMVTLVDRNLPLQVTLLLGGSVLNVPQLMALVPKLDPKVEGVVKSPPPMDDRGFCASVTRVVSNRLVTSRLLAASLLAAALWSYGYYRSDVIKVKYNMAAGSFDKSTTGNFADILQYFFLIIAVVFTAIHLCPPVRARWSCSRGAQHALAAGGLGLVALVLMMTLSVCEPGSVAVDRGNCSSQCGCAGRYVEFSPVCMLDELVTFPSPCHAGCSELEVVDGFSVYVNCSCGGRGARAVAGACGADRCRAAYDLHQVLFVVVAALVVSGVSTHGAGALRAVDARDRAVALGVGSAVVALALVTTHTYLAVAASRMCSLSAGGVCVLPSAGLPQLVGITSAVLVGLSCLTSMLIWLQLWRNNIRSDTDTHIQ